MKAWLVALVVLVGIPSAARAHDGQHTGMVREVSAQAHILQAQKSLARTRSTAMPVVLLGIVVALDPIEGALVLGHGDGTQSDLTADPGLLRKIRIGDPVKAVVEGSTVRTVEPLGAPTPRA